MKKVNVEKYILVNYKIDRLLNLNAQENLRVQIEQEGKRCVGYVDLKGQYLVDDEVRDFREYIECDIFAPIYKCTSEEFEVVLVDVNGYVENGILVNLEFDIHGIIDEDEMIVEDEELDLFGLDDLFDENENYYTNTILVVVKEGDTYESIAQRFQISVNELKKINNEIEIKPKQCILIPNT